eukprot:CAMPEP_0181211446 /NCGR_PEP_ID=MMETSP1096-20121128/23788_1 /TAXON_ID=156174 ORGANISM="Chrysochromulina ericina, Strain CCMP281" /NCGR_SAMPLE_ID=MMETSP1096 /ASSEMBLY_ACC=CAM_ASM_000453 /LENGTH=123 /DNA_ID=CAMNT_0023302843 /DNA_START=131 /DNA_END=502 /DNA_ORIENTATION=-
MPHLCRWWDLASGRAVWGPLGSGVAGPRGQLTARICQAPIPQYTAEWRVESRERAQPLEARPHLGRRACTCASLCWPGMITRQGMRNSIQNDLHLGASILPFGGMLLAPELARRLMTRSDHDQ